MTSPIPLRQDELALATAALPRVALVTPAFNEESMLPGLAATVALQSTRPVAWAIVDDGSTDSTGYMSSALAAIDPIVVPLTLPRDGGYAADHGAPAAAFNAGVRALREMGVAFDVVMKVDADLMLEPEYVARVAAAFRDDPQLGVASGVIFVHQRGRVVAETAGGNHTRGATKAYRERCLRDIGGVIERLGWDTVDEVEAHLAGYRVATLDAARALQRRPTGSTTGRLRGKARHGRASYLLGYPAWAVSARAVRRVAEPPFVAGSVSLLVGYCRAWKRGEERVARPEVVAQIRRQQRARLVGRAVR